MFKYIAALVILLGLSSPVLGALGWIVRDELGRYIDLGSVYRIRNNLPDDAPIPLIDAYDEHGETMLWLAVEENDPVEVGTFLRYGANPNVITADGYTALWWAAARDNLPIARLLLNKGANPNLGLRGRYPLDKAKSEAMRALLIKAGAVLSSTVENIPKRSSPVAVTNHRELEILDESREEAEQRGITSISLTRAVMLGYGPQDIQTLIENGAGVNSGDPVFGYPLNQAIKQNRSLEVIKLLLDQDVKANGNVSARLPLTWVFDRLEVMDLFIAYGADVNAELSDKTPILTSAVKNDASPAALERLLSAGAKVNALDSEGRPALYYALKNAPKSRELIKILLDKGASADIGNMRALAVLPWKNGSQEIAVWLLQKNARPWLEPGKRSLLEWAVEDNSPELFSLIMQKGRPGDDFIGENYDRALYQAVIQGQASMLQELVKAGAEVNSSIGTDTLFTSQTNGFQESTLLHIAVAAGKIGTVKALLEVGADINKLNYYNEPPLYIAVMKDNLEMARKLLEAGADPQAGEKRNNTPLYLARQKDNKEMIAILESFVR
ncbi:MAG: ankyrin repeat domain-containing protein [Desulfarculales bacterium]|jgi:ankyrin repeat protein|nr:ankyrin repeat domain-containing protein [Desulfarculales bacterium]